jgi:hypothetical protein
VSKLVLSLLVVLGLSACGSEPVSHVSTPAGPVDWSSIDPGWSTLEPPPFVRARAVSVWTETELFFWGGDTDFAGTAHADGATFDPSSGRWKPVPASPIGGRSSAAAAWTGEEVLVWGGWDRRGPVGDGAAYDPVDRSWRVLPDAPLGSRDPAASVWTGTELIVWGDASRSAKVVDGAAYDPAANEWRTLPPAPFALNQASAVWTGHEMIVFGALLDGNNASATKHARGLAYDPEANSWRAIAPSPFSPQASSVVWTGVQMLAWDYELRAATYEPDSDTWSPAPDVPLGFSECYPQGARVGAFVLAYHCGSAALFDLEAREWRVVPGRTPIYGPPVSAGEAVLFAGAAHEGGANALWVYKPALDGPSGFVPHTERRGTRTVMPLTFPDGTHVVLSYPEWLHLAELGVQPDVSYLHRNDPAPRYPLGFYFGALPEGVGPVVARTGRWTITAPGRAEDLDVLRRSIRVRETPDGLVALEPLPPLELAREFGEGGGSQLALGDLAPDPAHSSLDPLILLGPRDCGLPKPEISDGHGAMCLGDIYVGIYGDGAFVEAVLEGLRLEP